MGGRRQTALFRLAALLSGLLAALIVAELGARLLPTPRTHREPLQLDAELGFRGVPDFRERFADEAGAFEIAFDGQGFRTFGEAGPAVAPGTPRVLFLGDSFLVGLGLRDEEVVTARVGRALRTSLGARGDRAPASAVEVLNRGVIDTGTAQQLLLFESLAERIEPDVVVLAFYPGNDLINNSLALAGRSTQSPGDLLRPYLVREEEGVLSRRSTHPARAAFRSRSRLFALLEQRTLAFGRRRGWTLLEPFPPVPGALARLQGHLPPEPWLEIFQEPDPGSDWDGAWRQTFDLLRALRDAVETRGARLRVVVIPSALQVERGARALALDHQARRLLGRGLDRMLDWNYPERRLARFFEEERIEARFLLEPLRAAVRAGGGAVYAADGHLSASGHAVWAEVLAPPLAKHLSGRARSEESVVAAGALPGEKAWSSPVALLPAADSLPSVLDFAQSPHPELLGGGWGPWQAETEGGRGGRWMLARAMVVVPARPGSLVVRGFQPRGGEALVVRLDLDGVGGGLFPIDGSGDFRLTLRLRPGASGPSADGFVPLVISPRTESGRVDPPILIHSIGFEREPATNGQ